MRGFARFGHTDIVDRVAAFVIGGCHHTFTYAAQIIRDGLGNPSVCRFKPPCVEFDLAEAFAKGAIDTEPFNDVKALYHAF